MVSIQLLLKFKGGKSMYKYFLLSCVLGLNSIASATLTQEKDEFTRAWNKGQAMIDALIDEYQRDIIRIRDKFEDAIAFLPKKRRDTSQKVAILKDKHQAPWIKDYEHGVKTLTPLRNTNLVAFDDNVDELLFFLDRQCLGYEEAKATDPERAYLINDQLTCRRYIIKKLSPFQFGWFRYVKASYKHQDKGSVDINFGLFDRLVAETRAEIQEIANSIPNPGVSNYIVKMSDTQFDVLQKNIPALQEELKLVAPLLDPDIIFGKLAKLAMEYAKFDCLKRGFLNPSTIATLNSKFPVQDQAKVTPSVVLTPASPQQVAEPKAEPTLEKQDTLTVLPKTTPAAQEIKLPKEPKVSALDEKKQRRAAKIEQQRRAKVWVQQLYQAKLADADLATNRDLVSDFKWMNDLINPDITMTYQSIVGKLENLTKIKNGSGSRRHFIITDTPLGFPVACFYHSPHPDDPVKIEKWRLSITESLKKAGYFEIKN
jgi:hypothetical protein